MTADYSDDRPEDPRAGLSGDLLMIALLVGIVLTFVVIVSPYN